MKNKKIRLTKISSIVRRLHLPYEVEISPVITPCEGGVIVVEALDHAGKNNVFELSSGRIGKLIKGDIIPAVLGKRRALREYSCDIPHSLKPGDELYFSCESGLVGEINGVNENWGTPMKVKVLGSLKKGKKFLNIKDYGLKKTFSKKNSVPIIAVVGTCMDSGKTTIICKIAQYLRNKGVKISGAKLTGVAFMQDPFKMKDSGIDPVVDFVDAGLPSTCGNSEEVLQAVFSIIGEVNKSHPDVIIAEFGDGLIGEYHVSNILKNEWFKKQVKVLIVAANDLVAAWGAKQFVQSLGLDVDLFSGPAVNIHTGIKFIENHLNTPAESNLHAVPKTIQVIERKLKKSITKL